MSDELYTVLSLGMRYWFTLLGVLIVLRAFFWLVQDRHAKHRRLRRLPDAGFVGELVVLAGSDELPDGTVIPVPREGVLGCLRTCDIVVPVPGVSARHLDFSFEDKRGLMLRPYRRQVCVVDGQTVTHRSRPRDNPMRHGSRLQIGDAFLRLRVFAGLETAYHASFAEDDVPAPAPSGPWNDPAAPAPGFPPAGPAPGFPPVQPMPYSGEAPSNAPMPFQAYPPSWPCAMPENAPLPFDGYPPSGPVQGYPPAPMPPAPAEEPFAPAAPRRRRSLLRRDDHEEES